MAIEYYSDLTINGQLSITGDGSNAVTFIESGSGTMTIATADDFIVDATGDIILDAADNDVLFKDSGTHIGTVNMSSQNLSILSSVSDKDIIFKGNDGGSTITALTLDMSDAGVAYFNHDVIVPDNGYFGAGAGADLKIYHDGTDSLIKNTTGNLYVRNTTDDGDIIFQADDGSGGDATYLTLDGSATTVNVAKKLIVDTGSDNLVAEFKSSGDSIGEIRIADNSKYTRLLSVGTQFKIMPNDGDETVVFDGTTTTFNGTVTVGQDDTGYDVKFYGATSGEYMLWDESADALKFTDNTSILIGASNDLQLYHNGSHSLISNQGGNLYIRQQTNDGDILFQCDDGSGGDATYFFLDGSAATHDGSATTGLYTYFPDNSILALGSSKDFTMYHNGSTTYLTNKVGNLDIRCSTDDGDIILKCDDGSGGTTAYITLDGSAGYTTVQKQIRLEDSVEFRLGTGGDSYLTHNGSNFFLVNDTGDLTIKNSANDKDIIFQCDDGSGGDETYFYLDGSASSGNPYTIFPDNSLLSIGTGKDFILNHNGTNTNLGNYTGDLEIVNYADDKDVILKSDDGSGGTTAYLTLDGSTKTVDVDVPIEINDQMLLGSKQAYTLPAQGTRMRLLQIADNTICRIYLETSENSYHQPIVLDIFYRAQYTSSKPQIVRSESYEWHAHSNDVIFTSDQAGTAGADSYIYAEKVAYSTGRPLNIRKIEVFDGTLTVLDGSTTDTNGGTDETVVSTFAELNLGDSDYLRIGDGNDLQLYHDGSNSYVAQTGTGDLYIRNTTDDKDVILQSDDGSGGVATYIQLDGSSAKVLVNKPSIFYDTIEMASYLYHNGDTNTYIGYSAADTFVINTGGSNRVTVTDSTTTVTNALTVTGNITANGNIIGDDGTNITNINRIESDSFAADADNTTTINMSASQIDCLVADTDVFQVTDSAFTFDPAVKTSIHKRHFAKSSNTDGDHDGDVVYFGGTTSMTTGALYHYKSDGTWELADADAASTCDGLLGVALGAASDTNGVLLRGMVTLDHDPGAVGDVLYVSTTAGDTTATAPSGSGDIVRVIGYCIDASNGQIWFNPDGTFVEVA